MHIHVRVQGPLDTHSNKHMMQTQTRPPQHVPRNGARDIHIYIHIYI